MIAGACITMYVAFYLFCFDLATWITSVLFCWVTAKGWYISIDHFVSTLQLWYCHNWSECLACWDKNSKDSLDLVFCSLLWHSWSCLEGATQKRYCWFLGFPFGCYSIQDRRQSFIHFHFSSVMCFCGSKAFPNVVFP